MGCQWYLALTAAEFKGFRGPEKPAWMACHFSAHDTGLVNLPAALPSQALILVDDSTPIAQHDANRVVNQLLQLCRRFCPVGILLDLQRPKTDRAVSMVLSICRALPCPVAVTEAYGSIHTGPVLVSAPIHLPLAQVISPWKGRKIWLDLPLGQQTVLMQSSGKQIGPITDLPQESFPHWDKFLYCHYQRRSTPQGVQFTLSRGADSIPKLLQQADKLGIPLAISLYQEYKK